MVRKIFFGYVSSLREKLRRNERKFFDLSRFFREAIPNSWRLLRRAYAASSYFAPRNDAIFVLTLFFFLSCKHKTQEVAVEEKGTPVKVTAVAKKFLNDTLSLYGTLLFVKKTPLLSPIAGFIQTVTTSAGEMPEVGKTLFTLKTKEAAAYPDFVADTLFKNSVITVKANHHFRVDSVLKESGDFVQEGEILCQTVDQGSMVVQLNFPFEKKFLVKAGRNCEVIFPDGKKYAATVSKILPEVDAASQTQQAYLHINSAEIFPEFLNIRVEFTEAATRESQVLPKSAVLTDETMNEYWVMKLTNDSTAVREDVTTGRKTKGEVEIIEPVFSPDDRILISGNYGLEDTAKVVIVK
ncbi:MAG TPA: HlyD family efflux transporter periplasmic adaptor subunit [Chitinophagales bacterium]|nr:HlyD family efflux transporter periplasmic adaptor subunit [Chitinophagales bacterium]